MVRGIAALLILTTVLHADDWPQWRGPSRTGVSSETGLLAEWPASGLRELWRIDSLGQGYSGPAIVGERLYLCGSDDSNEFLSCRSVATGEEHWRVVLGPTFRNKWGDGSRGTPTVDGGFVFALGAQGVLVCADAQSGKLSWSTDLRKDHDGKLMKGNIIDLDWGYSEGPLVDGGRVILSPGGTKGTVMALDRKTGKQLWRTAKIADAASYSSAIVAEIGGVKQYIQLTGGVEYDVGVLMKSLPRAIGIAPETGETLWECKINYKTAGVINTPLAVGNRIYATCGYDAGCTILKIERENGTFKATDATPKDNRKVMKVYHGGVVPFGESVLGFSELNGWVCQAMPSGDVRWSDQRRMTEGCHIRVGKLIYIVTTSGTLSLMVPTEKGWTKRGEMTLEKESPTRAKNRNVKVCSHPVVANGRLFVRDQELLYCFDVKAHP